MYVRVHFEARVCLRVLDNTSVNEQYRLAETVDLTSFNGKLIVIKICPKKAVVFASVGTNYVSQEKEELRKFFLHVVAPLEAT